MTSSTPSGSLSRRIKNAFCLVFLLGITAFFGALYQPDLIELGNAPAEQKESSLLVWPKKWGMLLDRFVDYVVPTNRS